MNSRNNELDVAINTIYPSKNTLHFIEIYNSDEGGHFLI